ncbi:hypothetical protein A4H97_12325 [Niastella yeongjuensis]|uniref:DUF1634 domain-containing protein n=1 Tax=Niastella yeongjuensis TaxID=354355 RepID=A0A1V9EA21_9BACT|nr:DUF1634 domain-containing protein [Niastella yeongjuensis]OQP42931.1 hypothetical protein A4H97_12325 [Niastella yeongjuensis]SEO59967.1 Uncharacterized membrane protein [Niastella yeongjuensis]
MGKHRHTPEDKDLEIIMGNLLRYGVLFSAIIVVAGALIFLKQHGFDQSQYTFFKGEPERLTSYKRIWQTAFQGRGRSVIQLGLLFLIATPIARILFSIVGFVLEKDLLYTIITVAVLMVVLYGFL